MGLVLREPGKILVTRVKDAGCHQPFFYRLLANEFVVGGLGVRFQPLDQVFNQRLQLLWPIEGWAVFLSAKATAAFRSGHVLKTVLDDSVPAWEQLGHGVALAISFEDAGTNQMWCQHTT